MKKYTTLALIGAIVAGVAGLISIDAISATPLITMQGASDFHESGLMIGHVTYEVTGVDGHVKQYLQSDNLITNKGTDCAATAIFASADLVCATPGNFAFIAIGNATGPAAAPTDTALRITGTDGEMARSALIVASITPNIGTGTVVTLSNSGTPFTFTGLRTAGTTVTQSGLFNTGIPLGGNMFSIRDLIVPVVVTNADTLAVTWTITLT
jgi:hypothetical protein